MTATKEPVAIEQDAPKSINSSTKESLAMTAATAPTASTSTSTSTIGSPSETATAIAATIPKWMDSKSKSTISKPKLPSKSHENPLSNLIPGYIAPQTLGTTGSTSTTTSSTTSTLSDMIQQAQRTHDASTKHCIFPHTSRKASTTAMTSSTAPSSFKLGTRKQPPDLRSAGKGWFGMRGTEWTDAIKTDLHVLRNRSYLAPNQFYKRVDASLGTRPIQVGTVVEGVGEYYSSRLTNHQRRSNLTAELMADTAVTAYTKRKFTAVVQKREQQAHGGNHHSNNHKRPKRNMASRKKK